MELAVYEESIAMKLAFYFAEIACDKPGEASWN